MEADPEAYQRKVEKIRASYEQRKAEATGEKGLIVVFTGTGKGKSTAAFGMALRAVQHGMKLAVVQYVKGAIATAEPDAFARYGEQVEWHRMGEGFHWITQDPELDRRAAERAWQLTCELMARPDLSMIVLDEIIVSLRLKQLELETILTALDNKREDLHIVLTGRGATEELIARADLVTEMKMIKHPYRAGIKAQPGIEFLTVGRVELIACETCGSAEREPGAVTPGAELIAELETALAAAGELDFELNVASVRCLWSCTRSCAVHLRSQGRVGYVLCELRPDSEFAQALIEYARLYAHTPDGLVPLRQRPQALRGHFLCRIPALTP